MLIVQTPLRISFFGGGTDFEAFYHKHTGAVLSAAVNKRVYAIVKARFDDLIYINYSSKEIASNLEAIKHDLVREAMRRTGVTRAVEITTLADIPAEGTGMGSSSSILVALLHAFYAYKGELRTADELASEAADIEINVLRKPIGRQDHYIAAFGGLRFITFGPAGVKVEAVEISNEQERTLANRLLLFYTGVTRRSESVLFQQQANIEQRFHELSSLRDMAYRAKGHILAGELDRFGELLHESWERKKKLADGITNRAIDAMYETARQAGAIGGKIIGAGGGGFMLVYCPESKRSDVRWALAMYKEMPVSFCHDGTKIIFDYRSASE